MAILTIHDVVVKLNKVARTLANLNWNYDIQQDSHLKEFSFEDTDKIVNLLEERINILTHEFSMDISFRLQQVNLLLRYADFRQKYSDWRHEDLKDLIDGSTDIHIVRKHLNKHSISDLSEKRVVSQKIKAIKSEWNTLFANQAYSKVVGELNLKL